MPQADMTKSRNKRCLFFCASLFSKGIKCLIKGHKNAFLSIHYLRLLPWLQQRSQNEPLPQSASIVEGKFCQSGRWKQVPEEGDEWVGNFILQPESTQILSHGMKPVYSRSGYIWHLYTSYLPSSSLCHPPSIITCSAAPLHVVCP